MSTIQDTDFLVVNRGSIDYKISASDLDLYINPVPTFITAAVGSEQSNWSPYVTLRNYNTKAEYDPSLIFYFDTSRQNSDLIFDGNNNEIYQWASLEQCEMTFEPPGGIQVYSTFKILAGFAGTAKDGVLDINGEFAKRHTAHDQDPKYCEVPFSGTLDSFAIRQLNPASTSASGFKDSWSGGISEIVLDGKQLLNQTATTLTFESGEFFDQLRVGTVLQQTSPVAVQGVVSKIDANNKRVTLDELYSGFISGSTITILGADPIRSVSTRGVPVDNDLMLVNRNNKDYKISVTDLKLYIYPVPTFVTAAVGTEQSNWTPYIKAEDYDTNVELDIYNDNSIWTYEFSRRNPDIIFRSGGNKALLATKPSSGLNPEIIFEPPGGINVQQSVTFVAGFHQQSKLGTLSINGVDLVDIEAHDLEPKEFTVPFSGNLERFSIRQKEYTNPPGTMNGAPGIASISLDGKQLLNQTATTLTFEPGEFFDQLKIGTNLQQVSPEVTGVISKIYPNGSNKVVLDDEYQEFETGSTIIIVGADPL